MIYANNSSPSVFRSSGGLRRKRATFKRIYISFQTKPGEKKSDGRKEKGSIIFWKSKETEQEIETW